MKCNNCNQELSSRDNLSLTFCLNCNIWACEDHPELISPRDFCALIPEKPRPLTEKEIAYGLELAKRLEKESM